MSDLNGSILEEIKSNVDGVKIDGGLAENISIPSEKKEVFGWLPNILKQRSSDKPIEEYTEHPFNFDRKKSTGRIIRGLEGLMGALNYAIIDLIMGIVEKWKEGKTNDGS